MFAAVKDGVRYKRQAAKQSDATQESVLLCR